MEYNKYYIHPWIRPLCKASAGPKWRVGRISLAPLPIDLRGGGEAGRPGILLFCANEERLREHGNAWLQRILREYFLQASTWPKKYQKQYPILCAKRFW